jgi:hypothetical protein
MPSLEQTPQVKIKVDDVEFVDGKQPYLKISTPSVIESVRAVRKAAGLESESLGPTSVTG